MTIFNCAIYKTPLQIQLITTSKCNRRCEWCIEKENMQRKYDECGDKYIGNLCLLLTELNNNKIPYNIVLTGGEPTVNERLVLRILEVCEELMPETHRCHSSDNHKETKAYKLGINSNGDDAASPIYKHARLNYIDISFIDRMRMAGEYNENKPIRLQTVYRKSVFADIKSVMQFINSAIDCGYDSILFRQLIGEHPDKKDIFGLEKEISGMEQFAFRDYQINVYDLWVQYLYRNRHVYFKRQDLNAQVLFERINRENISSLVIWPDGTITKSWDFANKLVWPAL